MNRIHQSLHTSVRRLALLACAGLLALAGCATHRGAVPLAGVRDQAIEGSWEDGAGTTVQIEHERGTLYEVGVDRLGAEEQLELPARVLRLAGLTIVEIQVTRQTPDGREARAFLFDRVEVSPDGQSLTHAPLSAAWVQRYASANAGVRARVLEIDGQRPAIAVGQGEQLLVMLQAAAEDPQAWEAGKPWKRKG